MAQTGLKRRAVLFGAVGAVAVAGILMSGRGPQVSGAILTVTEAERAMTRGDLVLVDIRTPAEWAASGVAEGAVLLDMRRPDFIEALKTHMTGGKAIALICAGGVRSARMSRRLQRAGVDGVLDVPEGMMGSSAGPGWIRSGLPLVSWEAT